MSYIKYYIIIHDRCSCRDENNEPMKLASLYKQFYDLTKSGKRGEEALNELGLFRMCCRMRFLSPALSPMIDRTSDRYVNDTVKFKKLKKTGEIVTMHSGDIKIDSNLNFPIL